MKKMKLVLMVFFTILMATTVYTQELKSVSFDDYLKNLTIKNARYEIEIPEMLDLYKKGMVQIIDIRFSKNIRHTTSALSRAFR